MSKPLSARRLGHECVEEIDDAAVENWIVFEELYEHSVDDEGQIGVGVHVVHFAGLDRFFAKPDDHVRGDRAALRGRG